MDINKELEKYIHIRELQDKIAAALDYCLELQRRHEDEDLPGFDMVGDRLVLAIAWAETPLEPVPEDEELYS